LTDSDNKVVKWGNSLASFSYIYSLKNPNDTAAAQTAKLSGGDISLDWPLVTPSRLNSS
jgi:hypothetical protein